MNLGKYTLDTIWLFACTNLTLPITVLLKKSQIAKPIKTNTGKYGSLDLKTTLDMNVYTIINKKGSNIHQSQFK